MTHVIKGERATKPLLDQPGRQNSLASIAEALEYRRPNTFGRDGGGNHAYHNGGTRAATKRDKNPDGYACGGPKDGHALVEQGKAEPHPRKYAIATPTVTPSANNRPCTTCEERR